MVHHFILNNCVGTWIPVWNSSVPTQLEMLDGPMPRSNLHHAKGPSKQYTNIIVLYAHNQEQNGNSIAYSVLTGVACWVQQIGKLVYVLPIFLNSSITTSYSHPITLALTIMFLCMYSYIHTWNSLPYSNSVMSLLFFYITVFKSL